MTMERNIERSPRRIRKVKISATIAPEYVVWINKKIEDLTFANVSHAIEVAINHLMEEEEKAKRQG
ncbi:MAG: hypothetical protein ACQXXL_08445 [Candidatus Methanosuratincola sp.]|jgi:Arc/MetJ-type ribon-helix-helix transcriptional regulator